MWLQLTSNLDRLIKARHHRRISLRHHRWLPSSISPDVQCLLVPPQRSQPATQATDGTIHQPTHHLAFSKQPYLSTTKEVNYMIGASLSETHLVSRTEILCGAVCTYVCPPCTSIFHIYVSSSKCACVHCWDWYYYTVNHLSVYYLRSTRMYYLW